MIFVIEKDGTFFSKIKCYTMLFSSTYNQICNAIYFKPINLDRNRRGFGKWREISPIVSLSRSWGFRKSGRKLGWASHWKTTVTRLHYTSSHLRSLSQEVAWKWPGSGLEVAWKGSESGLKVAKKWSGSDLNVTWKWTGSVGSEVARSKIELYLICM